VKASDVQSVVALVEASPGYLSRGMKLVESRLAGDERVVLTTDPSKSMEGLRKLKHVADAQLWLMPYEALQARHNWSEKQKQTAAREMMIFLRVTPLYDARVRQFKGDFDGEHGAKRRYLEARPSQSQIEAIPVPPDQKKVIHEVKQAASYWLGLIEFDEKQYQPAVHWLYELVLIASPDGPWTAGARYNLGRTYEAMGETEKAVAQYQLDKSPQSVGNRLRARQLLAKSKR
jgi:tetratricopeptide (TPR) repeat protein